MAASLSSSLRLVTTPKPFSLFSKRFSKPSQFSVSSPISFQRVQTRAQIPPQNQLSVSEPSSINLSHLPTKLVEIITLFQSVPDPKTRYQQLLYYGTQLPPLDEQFKTESNRVHGCVSRVWVRAFRDSQDGATGTESIVRFEADSDSQLTKGIAALLVFGLSGSSVSTIARINPDFIDLLGIRQSLSPSRNSGMLNMLKLMQRKAIELDIQLDSSEDFEKSDRKDSIFGANSDEIESKLEEKEINSSVKDQIEEIVSSNYAKEEKLEGGFGGRKERIREKLERGLSPIELKIEDISHQHKGHTAMIGNSNGETHFNVRIVSKEFEGKSLVKRHRIVYDLLRDELSSGLHALSIDAKTESEI